MLTVKAKHATMLLTVSEVGGLSDGLEELEDEEEEMAKHPATHPSVVMVSHLHTRRCTHTSGLLHELSESDSCLFKKFIYFYFYF